MQILTQGEAFMRVTTHNRITRAAAVGSSLLAGSILSTQLAVAKPIVHDAEYYILEKQHAQQWSIEDKALDKTLADFRKKNGGKPPNIFYILIDDIGFGDLGSKTLNMVRGYKTPSINQFAWGGCTRSHPVPQPA
jgi:hypothetical protein